MKKAIKITLGIVLGLVIIIAIGFSYVYWQYNRALVTVQNNSGEQITNAEILLAFTNPGEGISIGTMANGREKTIKMHLKGENSVRLFYKDSLNKSHISNGEYMEGRGGYHIFFIINKSHKIEMKTSLFPH